jgi:hypothetical protein
MFKQNLKGGFQICIRHFTSFPLQSLTRYEDFIVVRLCCLLYAGEVEYFVNQESQQNPEVYIMNKLEIRMRQETYNVEGMP